MVKRKTTILIDEQLWQKLLQHVVKKYGTAKKTSEEIEMAVKEHLEQNPQD